MQFVKRRVSKIHVAIILLLILSVGLPALSLKSEAASTTSGTLKPVYITSNSYVKLDNADVMPSSKGRTASFTITYYNGGNSPINLQDYWVRLTSVSGTKYTAYLIDSDKTKKTVPAKSNVTLTFYSEVPSSVSLTDLVLKVIKFDFSVSGYERTLGKFSFPSSYNNVVKVNGYKAVKLSNTLINMRVNKSTISKGTDNTIINLEVMMRNTGNYEVTLSNLGFHIQSSKGDMYQMKTTTDSTQGILLRPQILETVKLTITLPSSVSTTGLKLVTSQSVGEAAAAINLPVAKFLLSLSTPSNTTTNEYEYVKGEYTYKVKVEAVQRNSWLTQDNVISKVTITNTGSKTAPIPVISGVFYLGDNAEIQTKLIPLGAQLSIAPQRSTATYYSASIPTSTNLSDLKVKLFEKDGETQRELAALKTVTASSPKTIALSTGNEINGLDEKLFTRVTEVRLMEGSTNNQYTIFMDVTNKQDHAVATSKLTGYLETSSGGKYYTSIIKTDNTISPSSKEQVILTAQVPKNIDLTGATLLLGFAYNDEGIVKSNEGVAKGFVNADRYILPDASVATADFSNIKIGAYTVNIDNLIAYLNDTTIDIDLSGKVTRDYSYEGFSSKKFSVVIEDESTNLVMIQAPIEIEAASGQYAWKLGNNYNNIVQDMSNKLISKTMSLNIYEEINGYKVKLVSKAIRWSPYLNWTDPSVK
ncbi:MAG: hypothetical protein ACE3L7_14695 [Candidatus Pristimantibacillus sp.]